MSVDGPGARGGQRGWSGRSPGANVAGVAGGVWAGTGASVGASAVAVAKRSEQGTYRHGLMLTIIGVLLMTPDALLIRLIDVDPWSLLIWRGGLTVVAMVVFLAVQQRGRPWRGFAGFGAAGILASIALGFANIGFIIAMTQAKAALVMVIFATVPLFGALIGWLGYGERVPRRTWVALPFATLGLAVAAQGPAMTGSAFALAMALVGTLMLATFLTVLRHEPQVNNYAALALGALLAAVAGLIGGDFMAIGGDPTRLGYVILLSLIIMPAATAFFTAGPRYISSADVGLVLLMETVIGPFWVWLALAERPAPLTIVGGAILIATLVVHSLVALRAAGAAPIRPESAPRSDASYGARTG